MLKLKTGDQNNLWFYCRFYQYIVLLLDYTFVIPNLPANVVFYPSAIITHTILAVSPAQKPGPRYIATRDWIFKFPSGFIQS